MHQHTKIGKKYTKSTTKMQPQLHSSINKIYQK